jgi:hypothetical protein
MGEIGHRIETQASCTPFSMTSASTPFSMTRRFPLPARRSAQHPAVATLPFFSANAVLLFYRFRELFLPAFPGPEAVLIEPDF